MTKEELTAAIKRERRIAEKRLDKNKRMQCYKCRKTGEFLELFFQKKKKMVFP